MIRFSLSIDIYILNYFTKNLFSLLYSIEGNGELADFLARRRGLQELGHGFLVDRVKELGGELAERFEDEAALRGPGVGNGQAFLGQDFPAVINNIDINYSGSVFPSADAAEFFFDFEKPA